MPQKQLHLISLGCTKNLVDSEVMLGRLQEYKISDNPKTADVIIINTCGFIDAAKEESINTILTTHQERKKDSLLVVSGCLTERYREQLQRDLPEVDIFTGVGDYEQIDKMIAQKRGIFSPQVYLANESSERVITGSNRHAYIKMAEGCNQSCSFCAIPSFKGKLHSRTLLSIEKEVKALVSKGFYEFSFISQDSSSYGRDIGIKKDGLIDLINVVEKIDGVKVARILYLYPSTTTFKLIDTIANSNVFETYYDMPIQQIDDTMLKLMRRGFGEKKTIELLEHMKSKKDAFIRSSIIVGHPGESDRAFERVCTFLKEFKFDRVNLFFYSNEETTPAFTMKPVEEVIIEERIEVLEAIAKETTEDSLKMMLGKTINLILEGESDEHEYILSARPTLWAKDIDGDILINDTSDLEIKFGALYQAKVTELVGDRLLATLIKEL